MTTGGDLLRTVPNVEQREAVGVGPALGAVDHLALSIVDLEASTAFYTHVLGFVVVMAVPDGRICMHPDSGFVIALLTHPGATRAPFTELNTGADHVGFAAASRTELETWERRFEALGVVYTPIRDELFGSHLNFRDPDNIALEISTSNELMDAARSTLATGPATAEVIATFIEEHLGPEFVPPTMPPSDQLDRVVGPPIHEY